MGDKCEWKDGKFEGCEAMESRHTVWLFTQEFNFCPFCGADIRKPEPAEPLIVKSGGTWVACWKEVDYLYGEQYPDPKFAPPFFTTSRTISPGWKSFTGPNPDITELTDDIAKLRPMVISSYDSKRLWKLLGVNEGTCFLISGNCTHMTSGIYNTRLATAHELQES